MFMPKPNMGKGVVTGAKVRFGKDVTVWNYVVIGDNANIGDETIVGSFCDIGKNVVIGKGCNIQAHVTISNECRIGDTVFIAPNTSLLNDKYPKSGVLTPVVVKNNAIIGGGVTILPGVTVGEESVVGGGSVVTRDVPPKTVVMGVPARPAMTLEAYKTKREAFLGRRDR
jgi:acetyltransferase-like isoleucine patch superfamily enzyme